MAINDNLNNTLPAVIPDTNSEDFIYFGIKEALIDNMEKQVPGKGFAITDILDIQIVDAPQLEEAFSKSIKDKRGIFVHRPFNDNEIKEETIFVNVMEKHIIGKKTSNGLLEYAVYLGRDPEYAGVIISQYLNKAYGFPSNEVVSFKTWNWDQDDEIYGSITITPIIIFVAVLVVVGLLIFSVPSYLDIIKSVRVRG